MMRGSPNEIFARQKELLAMDLDLPFTFKLKDALLKEGFDVQDIDSPEGLVSFLCR